MFLRALGTPAQDVPATLAEQVAMYCSLTAGRSRLLPLDDGFSAAQVRVLLPALLSSMAIVTSRGRLAGLVVDGARSLDMAPLTDIDAVRLLARMVGSTRVNREPRSAEQLVGACGGFPIALRLAASRLITRPRLSMVRVVAELTDETNRLRGLSTAGEFSVAAAFDVSYRSLDGAVAALYRRLALHPVRTSAWARSPR